ncbi:unnamed protein product [Sphagnum jensenii]|uniref:Calcineurin-binding protein cabin-1 n=1 Tax=Sphagnum jensenii TaxID=128206 RepID=A0ABP1C121_9BRYO
MRLAGSGGALQDGGARKRRRTASGTMNECIYDIKSVMGDWILSFFKCGDLQEKYILCKHDQFSITAINDVETSQSHVEHLAPTKEAQESWLTQMYGEALSHLQQGQFVEAQMLFQAILEDPISLKAQIENATGTGPMLQLRYSTLKNLAETFSKQGSDHYNSALECYLQAAAIDSKDVVLWNRLGTLACSLGELNVARRAFEQGLHCNPRHWSCMEKLAEVLIAIGDEVACLAIAKRLLRLSPSHPRALQIKHAIERSVDILEVGEGLILQQGQSVHGIDLLTPEHLSLSFSNKRKLDTTHESDQRLKKSKVYTIDVSLPEASWFALVNAVTDVLKGDKFWKDRETLLSSQIVVSPGGNGSGEEKNPASAKPSGLVNAAVTFLVQKASPKSVDPSAGIKVKGALEEQEMGLEEVDSYDWEQPSHERRSTRLEKLRSGRRLDKEEDGFVNLGQSKDPAKALKKGLEPFIICTLPPNTSSMFGSADMQQGGNHLDSITNEEERSVLQFLKENAINSGIFEVGQKLLEHVVASSPMQRKSLCWLLFLDKLMRTWAANRSPGCSLFLAEVYMDMATSATNDVTASQCLSDCNYNLCRLLEGATLQETEASQERCQMKSRSTRERDARASGEGYKMVGTSEHDKMLEQSLDDVGERNSGINNTVEDDKNWSFWARLFWLRGRLWIHSGQWEQAYREFERCQRVIESQAHITPNPLLLLPHCKLDNEISLECVQGKLYELQMENLLKHSAVRMLEQGEYAGLIKLLSPVLLSGKGRASSRHTWKGDGVKRVESAVLSHELKGLDMLVMACEKTKPPNIMLALECRERRLKILCSAAGLVESNADESSTPSSAANGFNLLESELDHEQHNQTGVWNLVADEVKHISRCTASIKEKMDEQGGLAMMVHLPPILGRIQMLLLTLICNFVGALSLCKAHSGLANLSLRTQFYSNCFVDAATSFCQLQHLHSAVPIEQQIALLATLHDVLAEYGLCCAGKECEGGEGAFLKMGIKHLGSLELLVKPTIPHKLPLKSSRTETNETVIKGDDDTILPESPPAPPTDNGEAEENENISQNMGEHSVGQRQETTDGADMDRRLELGLDYALDQSFFCLYGLNLRGESASNEGLTEHQNTNRGDYKTKEQCAGVLQYILPYAKACSRAGLVKLKKVLRAVYKQFLCPPGDFLADNSVEPFLEDPDFDEDKLQAMIAAGTSAEEVIRFALQSGRLSQHEETSSYDKTKLQMKETHPYFKVYENLYYLLVQVEDMSASDKWPGFVLTKEGEDFVEQNANLFKYDLCYNPTRFESWQKLAKLYDEEVDLLLNDGSKNLSALDWRKSGLLPSRVELSRRQSRRCLLMALALASTPEQKSEVNELLALVYYDSIQNVVPSFDQRRHVPIRDSTWLGLCQKAFFHFEVAFSLRPHWTHVFYLGKLSEKLGHLSVEALSYYRKAVEMNSAGVDPLYRLHASRLKLLCRTSHYDQAVLQVVAEHCFLPHTMEKVHIFSGPGKPKPQGEVGVDDDNQQLKQAWRLLFDDCIAALQSCFDGELKHFHKARYRMAVGLHCRGDDHDSDKSKEELAFCFKTQRSLFTINMWEIDESHLRKSRRRPAHQRVLELGMPESSRKFITCVRKYLLFYLTLCEEAGDLFTLERAYTSLKTDRKFSLCLEDISRVALGKYIQTLARALCQAESEGSRSQARFHSLLEKMFNLYMDYGVSWSDSAGLSLTEAGILNAPEVAESAIYSYIHRYFHLLEGENRVDALEAVNERIRKRFKNPKLISAQSAQVCRHASLAWCRALCMALCSITVLPSESMPLTSRVSANDPDGKSWDQEAHFIVDLQEEFTATNYYDAQPLSTPKEGNPKRVEPAMITSRIGPNSSSSELYHSSVLAHIKNVPVKQATIDNLEKATALLRSSYVFYRDSFSGPFPGGINLFITQPGKSSVQGGATGGGVGSSPLPGTPPVGSEVVDISTPRKLLLWAYALAHGRTGSVAEAVKYCEEQTKPRVKKGLTGATPPLPPASGPSGTQERTMVNVDRMPSASKQPPAEGSWLPGEREPPGSSSGVPLNTSMQAAQEVFGRASSPSAPVGETGSSVAANTPPALQNVSGDFLQRQ